MRALVGLIGAFAVMPATAAEPFVFYTADFPDETSVSLRVLSERALPREQDDFEVTIGLSHTSAGRASTFIDRGNHRARIRCEPASVSVGGQTYLVQVSGDSSDDWKTQLWRTFCTSPSS
jgi:hypothetical protein